MIKTFFLRSADTCSLPYIPREHNWIAFSGTCSRLVKTQNRTKFFFAEPMKTKRRPRSLNNSCAQTTSSCFTCGLILYGLLLFILSNRNVFGSFRQNWQNCRMLRNRSQRTWNLWYQTDSLIMNISVKVDFCVSSCLCVQEEELQELSSRISVCQEEFKAVRTQMQTRQRECEEAEQLYRQQREALNSIAEEAEPIKVWEVLFKSVCNIISSSWPAASGWLLTARFLSADV